MKTSRRRFFLAAALLVALAVPLCVAGVRFRQLRGGWTPADADEMRFVAAEDSISRNIAGWKARFPVMLPKRIANKNYAAVAPMLSGPYAAVAPMLSGPVAVSSRPVLIVSVQDASPTPQDILLRRLQTRFPQYLFLTGEMCDKRRYVPTASIIFWFPVRSTDVGIPTLRIESGGVAGFLCAGDHERSILWFQREFWTGHWRIQPYPPPGHTFFESNGQIGCD